MKSNIERRWKLKERLARVRRPIVRLNAVGGIVLPDILSNLIAGWNFQTFSAGKFAADFGGTNYDLASGSASAVAGLIGNAASYVFFGALPFSPGLNFAGGVFTGCLWLNTPSMPVGDADIISNAALSAGYILRISSAGVVTFFAGNGTGYDSVVAGSSIAGNTWYFVAFKVDGAGKLWISLSGTGGYNNFVSANMSGAFVPTTVSVQYNNTRIVANSLQDTTVFYDRALSDTDLNSIYNNGAGRSLPF